MCANTLTHTLYNLGWYSGWCAPGCYLPHPTHLYYIFYGLMIDFALTHESIAWRCLHSNIIMNLAKYRVYVLGVSMVLCLYYTYIVTVCKYTGPAKHLYVYVSTYVSQQASASIVSWKVPIPLCLPLSLHILSKHPWE